MTQAINQGQVEWLFRSYTGFMAAGKIKSYMALLREELELEWISSRGIYQKFGVWQDGFLGKEFFNWNSDKRITYYATPEKVEKVIKAIEKFITSLRYSNVDQFNIIDSHIKNGSSLQTTQNKFIEEPAPTKVEIPMEMVLDAVGKVFQNSGINLKVDSKLAKIEQTFHNKAEAFEKVASELIKEEVAKLAPTIIRIADRPEVKVEGTAHKALAECIHLANLEKQVFIAGPAGTGKTTLAEQTAHAFNLPFGHISCTLGMSEAHLLGRMNANGDYLPSLFVEIYENGGVFLFDEVDAADPNTMLIINSALANGSLSVPNRVGKPTARRHKDFYCICAANTWGFGSNDYAGRNILDAAFLDRFTGSRMVVDYDKDLEAKLAGTRTLLLSTIWKIRDNVKASKIKRVVSTRAIISGTRAITAGDSLQVFIDRFTTGWTSEEKSKALINLNLN